VSSPQVERDVVRHCHAGLDVGRLQHQVLRCLRRGVPVDAAFFATADPETLLFTGAHSEDPLGAAMPLFLDNEFGGVDVNRFATLACAPSHVGSLDAATRGDRPASARYREILRRLGLGDELRAALVARSECWGYLCLHREDGTLGFTGAETDLVARLAPHVAHGLRQAVLLHGVPQVGEIPRPGVVLLDDRLELVASTPEAEHLLSLVEGGRATGRPLPVALYAVAAALEEVERGTAPAGVLPTVRVRSAAGGWLTVHASRLDGSPGESRIAVVVEPAEPRAALQILLSAYGLSPRERDVTRLVLRGASTTVISGTLHIASHTVQDHLKAVFDKVGVRSRRDLVGVLLAGAGRGPGNARGSLR
jgi:DNA-binding CsgD family transcriptional regulator